MSDIICPTCGTNGLDCLRKDCQMVADQLAPWTGREVFASMADAVNPLQSRFRCDVHGSYTEAGCATCRAQALQTTQLGVTPVNPLQAQLDAAKARIVGLEKDFKRSEREWETMRAALAAAEARMAIDDAPKPLDPGAGAVAGRVDGVIQDALAGRLTKGQKAGVRSAIDRSDRVSPSSDQAVGKAIGG